MQKFWSYELLAIGSFSISLADINAVLQLIILIFGVWSAFKAWRNSEKK